MRQRQNSESVQEAVATADATKAAMDKQHQNGSDNTAQQQQHQQQQPGTRSWCVMMMWKLHLMVFVARAEVAAVTFLMPQREPITRIIHIIVLLICQSNCHFIW